MRFVILGGASAGPRIEQREPSVERSELRCTMCVGTVGGTHTRRCIRKGGAHTRRCRDKAGHAQGSAYTRRCIHKAVHAQGSAYTRRCIHKAICGHRTSLVIQGGCGGGPPRGAKQSEVHKMCGKGWWCTHTKQCIHKAGHLVYAPWLASLDRQPASLDRWLPTLDAGASLRNPLKSKDSCGGYRPPCVCPALCVHRLRCALPCVCPSLYVRTGNPSHTHCAPELDRSKDGSLRSIND